MVILYVECGFVGNCRETVFEEVFCRQIVRPAHLGLRLIFSRIEQQKYMVNFLTGLPFFSRKMEKRLTSQPEGFHGTVGMVGSLAIFHFGTEQ